jgi:hypothetical protein
MEKKINEEKREMKYFTDEKNTDLTKEQKQKEMSKSLDKLIELLSKYNEIRGISSQINSLKTTVRNAYYLRYTKKGPSAKT